MNCDVSCRVFVDVLYQWKKLCSIPSLLRYLIMNGCWTYQMLSASIDKIVVFFFSLLI